MFTNFYDYAVSGLSDTEASCSQSICTPMFNLRLWLCMPTGPSLVNNTDYHYFTSTCPV